MKNQWDYQNGGKTSVKIHNTPGNPLTINIVGGNSQICFGWDQPVES